METASKRALAGHAARIAEKVRRRVEVMNVEHAQAPYGYVTVSVGCATCRPPAGDSGAKLLAAADQQLYEAKAAGRNRVHTLVLTAGGAEPPQPAAPHGAATWPRAPASALVLTRGSRGNATQRADFDSRWPRPRFETICHV